VTRVPPAQQGETSTQMQTQRSQPHTGHTTCANENVTEWVSPSDTYYCSSKFLEEVDQLESMAREQIQQRKWVACSPPSFSLGISLEKETSAAHSAHTTPAIVELQLGENTAPRGSLVTGTEQHIYEGSEHPISAEKSPKTTKGTHKAAEK